MCRFTLAGNGYRLGEDWAIEFQLLGLARLAKLVPGQITIADSYSTADGQYSSAQIFAKPMLAAGAQS